MEQATAIHLKDISKKYSIYNSPKDHLKEVLSPNRKKYHREFWALKNIDFKIPAGQTVGILGLNGSGKSTLLQIISSVLQPSSGEMHVNGRVAALLELGAGFNPQLTGLENVKLNLSIMGLNKKKIEAALPIIMDFADIGDFFYQPIQVYSSGMFARLAFATAINVDPDILIIDEALSVGDAKFQQKCFKKFAQFQEAGKTILFVTHDRFSIARLCSMAILLHKGEMIEIGQPKEVVESYGLLLSDTYTKTIATGVADSAPLTSSPSALPKQSSDLEYFLPDDGNDKCYLNPTYNKNEFRYGTKEASILNYCIISDNKINMTSFYSGSVLKIYLLVKFHRDVETPIVGYTIKSKDGVLVSCSNSRWLQEDLAPKQVGSTGVYCFDIKLNLCDGDWFIDLAVADSETSPLLDNREGLIHMQILPNRVSKGIALLDTQICEIPLEQTDVSL